MADKPITDKLIELFQQLINLCNKVPSKNSELLKKCQNEAEKKLLEKAKAEAEASQAEAEEKYAAAVRASGLSAYCSVGEIDEKPAIEIRKPQQWEIENLANQKYHQADPDYVKTLSQVEQEMADVAKQIDHTLLIALKNALIYYDYNRTKDTLLVKDWKEIRDSFSIERMVRFQNDGSFAKTIDALEIIKADVNFQRQLKIKSQPAQEEKPESTEDLADSKPTNKDDMTPSKPKNLITLTVAIENFIVSRLTLLRAIKENRLKTYRPENAAKNAQHKVDAVEVAKIWPRRN